MDSPVKSNRSFPVSMRSFTETVFDPNSHKHPHDASKGNKIPRFFSFSNCAAEKRNSCAGLCPVRCHSVWRLGRTAGTQTLKSSTKMDRSGLRANLSACDRSERDAGCHKGDLVVGKNDSHVAEIGCRRILCILIAAGLIEAYISKDR